MQIYFWRELDENAQARILTRPALLEDANVRDTVARIVDRVKRGGDAALAELSVEIDGRRPNGLIATENDFEEARDLLSAEQRLAIETAALNIATFHRAQITSALDIETAPGVRCERIARPLQSVGLYVPAGVAPLPSTALMLGVPAKIAGCPTRILCSPLQANGKLDPAVLYAAKLVDVERVFKIGGAQAIAAMAYGTDTVPRVDKIFGPGNAWVTAAKALVSQDPQGAARDMPAGPSEVLVIADKLANPVFVAADLLSQAEHGSDSQVLLLTDSRSLGEKVVEEVAAQARRLSRAAIVDESLSHSSVIVVESIEAAIDLANRYAPEHLILQVENPRRWLPQIYAAGSVFLGPWTPESIGDYCSGTNHVLPTYGFARSYSSLGTGDFLRVMTVQELTPQGLQGIGPTAETLAALEGLDGHAQAVSRRLASLAELESS